MTSFNDITASYLAEKRAIGYKMEKEEAIMRRISALHAELGCKQDDLPKKLVDAWTATKPGEKESTRLARVSQIRCLAQYMTRMGYSAYVTPEKNCYIERGSYKPYIFTSRELESLFAAADDLAGDNPSSKHSQLALIIRLLYSTGMRSGEVCGLCKDDVDLDAGIFTVRGAKNDKDRFVPLHPSMIERLRIFVSHASVLHPHYAYHNKFWSLPEDSHMTTSVVYVFFRKALWKAGISHGGRGKGPRVHDLRFTFACHRLRAWVEEGADINAMLPVLSAYMGHADTRCTEYYLRLTAELFPRMVSQIEAECGWMVPS